MIKEWEDADSAKDQEVHQYRLQNIALRNRLANQHKVLRKKEQLADGLHLIDFEQLKIENQTLNEKIEERNDELSKLRAKIVANVIILSHNREKYQFIMKQNEKQQKALSNLDTLLKDNKEKLASETKKLKKKLFQNVKLSQTTGIVSKNELTNDYEKRMKEEEALKNETTDLKEKHAQLLHIIEEAQMAERQYSME